MPFRRYSPPTRSRKRTYERYDHSDENGRNTDYKRPRTDNCVRNRESDIHRLRNIKNFDNFNTMYLENFENLTGQEVNLNEDDIRILMRVLKKAFRSPNKELCNVLQNNTFFNRLDIITILSSLLVKESLSENDLQFVKDSAKVTLAFALDSNTKEIQIKNAMNLIISILQKASQDVKMIDLAESLKRLSNVLNLKGRREILEGDERKTTEYSEVMEMELSRIAKNPILPTSEMIKLGKTPKLVPRVLRRPLQSDSHYLVEQFDLFLEDFIGPLCLGIRRYTEYITNQNVNEKFRDDNVRLYKRLKICDWKCIPEAGVVIEVQFDVSSFKRLRWESCNFLQFGNVVCLTYDACDTLVYALIADRCVPNLKEGKISLNIIDKDFGSIEQLRREGGNSIVMLESKAFYTAYRFTLESLKAMAWNMLVKKESIPFSKHLVEMNTNVLEPLYTREKIGESKTVDFKCLLKYGQPDQSYAYRNIPFLHTEKWPSGEELGMDICQYSALKLCLTTKVGILQGPPGTGKTWMGLRLVEFLLCNSHNLQGGEQHKPILLLSYTNHALDQFLDALLSMDSLRFLYSKRHYLPFVRVGSRSKNERVQKCTLKEHRKIARCAKWSKFNSTWKCLMGTKKRVHILDTWLQHLENSIVSARYLYDEMIMSEHHKESFVREIFKYEHMIPDGDSIFLAWLCLMEPAIHKNVKEQEIVPEHVESPITDIDNELNMQERMFRIIDDDDNLTFNEKEVLQNIIPYLTVSEEILCPKNVKKLPKFWKKCSNQERVNILHYVRLHLRIGDTMNAGVARNTRNVWNLSIVQRWALYRYWIQMLREKIEQEKNKIMYRFETENKNYQDVKHEEDFRIISNCSIVCMTTTGAAQNMRILRKLEPRIVIVEEAAQVHEQHILACLTKGLQHLILIGDHQQLRPSINNYELSKTHHTDVSLMERLVLNNMPFQRLSEQHRMRPEISCMLTPTIYENLENHSSVLHYKHVTGMKHDIFFLDHRNEEKQSPFSTSHENEFEADLISHLYRYLVQQGYSQSDITIISPYNDQVKLIRQKVRKIEMDMKYVDTHNRDRVNITAVDNFQGEENKIILLSLVRSNKEEKLGYLHDPKRICVSLSRAQHGFYVIGNFQMLKKSKTWRAVLHKAEDKGILKEYLPLQCMHHPENITNIRTISDFSTVPDGGCNKSCDYQLSCGHKCDRKCHSDQSSHDQLCMKKCLKFLCDQKHRCQKMCYEVCGKCMVRVRKQFLACEHGVITNCSTQVETIICQKPCGVIFQCGHQCERSCGQICLPDQCSTIIEVDHPRCHHKSKIHCCEAGSFKCKQKCSTNLPCGHRCQGTCNSCLKGRLHEPCQETCKRVLFCGHTCNTKHACSSICPPCRKPCSTSCWHLGSKGCRLTCGEICIPCREICDWKCRNGCKNSYRCTSLCSEECNRPPCNRRCRETLPCKPEHRCIGLCGEECPKLCKRCDKEELTTIFFGTEDEPDALFIELTDCKHVFEVNAMDQYMNMKDESDNSIQLKRCPKCKTPIRRSRRYKNQILQTLRDMNDVKRQIQKGDKVRTDICSYNQIRKDMTEIGLSVPPAFSIVRNRKTEELLLCILSKFKNKYSDINSHKYETKDQCSTIIQWILNHSNGFFAEYELNQFALEMDRFFLYIDFILLKQDIECRASDEITDDDICTVTKYIENLKWPDPDVDNIDEAKCVLDILAKKMPRTKLGISEEERKMILKAMSFSKKGHWYKCKNGHIYAIGDCGGATVESRCPECQAEIGGIQHRLRSDNDVASEMDGATYSAWSEHANMANYQLD